MELSRQGTSSFAAPRVEAVVGSCGFPLREGAVLEEPTRLWTFPSGLGWVLNGVDGVVWCLRERGDLSRVPLRAGGRVTGSSEQCVVPMALPGPEPRLLLVSERGELRREVREACGSPPNLRLCSATLLATGRLLAGYADLSERQGGRLRIFDADGSSRWLWSPGPRALIEPKGLDATSDGTLLVADPQLHVLTEVDQSGRVLWRHGTAGNPGGGATGLRAPTDCRAVEGGALIADSMNHRVLEVRRDGQCSWEVGAPLLHLPRAALRLPNGDTLVADTGHQRVVRLTASGRVGACWGPAEPPSPLLCHPRSVELLPDGVWLVADTNNHRVVEIDSVGRIRHQYGDGVPGHGNRLHWPRCAILEASGRIAVADGVNGRIVRFDRRGGIHQVITGVVQGPGGPETAFLDPHDIQPLPGNGLLCTDSRGAFVVALDASGCMTWAFGMKGEPGGGELHDPHQAHRLTDGSTWIVDSLNHRLLKVGRGRGNVKERIHAVSGPGGEQVLVYPRGLERHGRGWIIINGDGALLLLDEDFRFRARVGPGVVGGSCSQLAWNAPPRFVKSLSPDRIAVSDYERGRILVVADCRID